MEDKKYFGILIWVNDDPITGNVLSLKNIVEPRKPIGDYRERDRVMAKCPGYGVQPGVVGKISDEMGKKELDQILAGEGFKDLVATVVYNVAEAVPSSSKVSGTNMEKKRTEEEKKKKTTTNDNIDRKKNITEQGKKRKLSDEVTSEAKQAKKTENQEKRDREKEREAVNYSLSRNLIDNNKVEKKIDMLLDKVTSLANACFHIKMKQQVLETKLDNLTEIANCPKCLRTKYKLAQRENSESTTTKSIQHTPQLHPREVVPQVPTVSATVTEEESVCITMENTKQKSAEPEPVDGDANSTLVYLGDSKYGIKVPKERLYMAKACSKDITKLALNIIEFLVTPEECKNQLTVYGEGKGKTGLDPNKRKALRSELFSNFYQHSTEEEQMKLWQDTVVPKLNNKIRGIRNNRYNKL